LYQKKALEGIRFFKLLRLRIIQKSDNLKDAIIRVKAKKKYRLKLAKRGVGREFFENFSL
jgi:hypothetical protein